MPSSTPYRPTSGYTPREYRLIDHLSPQESLIFKAALYRQFSREELETMLVDLNNARAAVKPPPPTGLVRRRRGSLRPKDRTLRRIRIALGLGPRASYVITESVLTSKIAGTSPTPISTLKSSLFDVLQAASDPLLPPFQELLNLLAIIHSPRLASALSLLNDHEIATSALLLEQAAAWVLPEKVKPKPPIRAPRPKPPPASTNKVEIINERHRPRTVRDLLE